MDEDSRSILTIDHYVAQRSAVPSIFGQTTQLHVYVRERVRTAMLLRSANLDGRIVLFVHGAGTSAEVAFDVPYQDYSWLAYLATQAMSYFL